MPLKEDLEKEVLKLKTERDFAVNRLEDSYKKNYDLRQEVLSLKQKLNLIPKDGKV
jgi:hypothetical protein|tara:strand:+ start:486 stop:653 length:168 start_codon:yes stop_codon:yes gene_type:complete